jgi:hypothetical protein
VVGVADGAEETELASTVVLAVDEEATEEGAGLVLAATEEEALLTF